MNLFRYFFGTTRLSQEAEKTDPTATKLRLATTQLLQEYKQLLDNGYGHDPAIRARGPLMAEWPHALDWFGACQFAIVSDFVNSRPIWHGEVHHVIGKCQTVIHEWCQKHGSSLEDLSSREMVLLDGLHRFKPVLQLHQDDATNGMREQFLEWAENHQEFKEYFSQISLFLADDAMVFEYLGTANAIYNERL